MIAVVTTAPTPRRVTETSFFNVVISIQEKRKEYRKYWRNAGERKKTPIIKEKSSHNCALLPLTVQLSLIATCIFNYADVVTDILATAGMFREGKKVLGGISAFVIAYTAAAAPIFEFHANTNKTGRKFIMAYLKMISFSSTPVNTLKILINHRKKNYDRTSCPHFKTGSRSECLTEDSCRIFRHKIKELSEVINGEKMFENQAQFILQLINIAPDYLKTAAEENDVWHYLKLVSLFFTLTSLARACVKNDVENCEIRHDTFSFYSIGKGWMALRPQVWLLFLIHTTALASRVLTVVLLMILVNHDFGDDVESGSCSLSTALEAVKTQSKSTCYFETKVVWLLFLCAVAQLGCYFMIPNFINVWTINSKYPSIRQKVERMIGVSSLFAVNAYKAAMQLHFMDSFTDHMQKVKILTFGLKIAPSFFQALGTITLATIVHKRGDRSFTNTDLGISPFHLAMVAVGIEILHLSCLFVMENWVAPKHIKSISDEKMLDILIEKDHIDLKEINASCSRSAKEIIREAIMRKKVNLNISKEDVEKEIVKISKDPSKIESSLLCIFQPFIKACRPLKEALTVQDFDTRLEISENHLKNTLEQAIYKENSSTNSN